MPTIDTFDNGDFFRELIRRRDAEISLLKLELDMWRVGCCEAMGGIRFYRKEVKRLGER